MVIFGARGEQRDEKMDLIKKQNITRGTFLFTGCTTLINSGDGGRDSRPQINALPPQLLSGQEAEPLPQNCSDAPPSETNPSNPENGETPAAAKETGGKFHPHRAVEASGGRGDHLAGGLVAKQRGNGLKRVLIGSILLTPG